MIQLKNISKYSQSRRLLKKINITVNEGEIYGLIGSDHSRKSLLLKLMLGVVKISEGHLMYFGENFNHNHLKYIGVAMEAISFYGQLTGRENIDQYFRKYPNYNRNSIETYFEIFDLTASLDLPVNDYSSGMIQKLRIIRALIIEPKILILDEPMKALDPVSAKNLREILIRRSKNGTTIFITTSMLSFISEIASRVAVLHYGEIIEEIDTLDKRENQTYVEITSTMIPKVLLILERTLNIFEYEVMADDVIRVYSDCSNSEIIKVLVNQGVIISGVRNGWRSLETYFLNTIGD